MAHPPDVPVSDDLLSRRLFDEERRGAAEEVRYPGYEVHHGVSPVLLPIVNWGFIDLEELSDLPLEKPQLKPPLLDMVSPGGKDFRDIRRFLAFKNDFEAIPIGNASMSVVKKRKT